MRIQGHFNDAPFVADGVSDRPFAYDPQLPRYCKFWAMVALADAPALLVVVLHVSVRCFLPHQSSIALRDACQGIAL